MDDYGDRKMDVVRDTYFEQNHDFQNKFAQFGSVFQSNHVEMPNQTKHKSLDS